jgi:hypothetical protein
MLNGFLSAGFATMDFFFITQFIAVQGVGAVQVIFCMAETTGVKRNRKQK